MTGLWQDVRYAFRSLAKAPAFTIVTLFTLALGIGANSAIFSVVNGVLIRPFPYRDAGRLVLLRETYAGGQVGSVSGPNFLDWRARSHAFSSMSAARGAELTLLGTGEPEEIQATLISSDFLHTVGVSPLMGRGFLPGEDQGQGTIALISEPGTTNETLGLAPFRNALVGLGSGTGGPTVPADSYHGAISNGSLYSLQIVAGGQSPWPRTRKKTRSRYSRVWS